MVKNIYVAGRHRLRYTTYTSKEKGQDSVGRQSPVGYPRLDGCTLLAPSALSLALKGRPSVVVTCVRLRPHGRDRHPRRPPCTAEGAER